MLQYTLMVVTLGVALLILRSVLPRRYQRALYTFTLVLAVELSGVALQLFKYLIPK